MVDGVPLVLLGIEGKHREIDDPEEVQGGGIDRELLKLGDAKTDPTEHGAGTLPGIGAKEDQVPLLHAEALCEGGLLGVGEELHDGGLPLAVLDLDKGETLGSGGLGKLGEFLDLARRDGGEALGVHRLDDTARIEGRAEDLELALLEDVPGIPDLHAEAGVGLVTAVAVHRVGIRHALEGNLQVDAASLAEDPHEHPLDQVLKIFGPDERGLDVDLGELGLTVGPQILVAETAGDLEVLVDAADHEELLVLLGSLGKGVEGTRRQARGNQEVAGPFGGALGENRRLDFPEAGIVEFVAEALGHAVTEAEIGRHGGTTQVEEAMGEAQILVGDLLVHRERGNLGAVQDGQGGGDHLDLSGGELRIFRPGEARRDLTTDGDDILGAEGVGGRSCLGMDLGAEDHLRDAVTVAKVDEDDAAMVAAGGDPAAEGHVASDVGRAQGAAEAITVMHGKDRCLG